ncbi:hypothetical protein Xbed_03770 [Xenorhabdus beddingii]|uniref:Uncharacterized protein n=1 Tax=Xenorhabdus beddingii TaxID=40578 RepID=A0A1Y2S7T5_9GAMM|nr:hypothetical protein Xbed_03770 [Xenorhabdus beddingii]
MLLQLLAGLDIGQGVALTQGLADKGLVGSPALKGHLHYRPDGRILEHARFTARHRQGQRDSAINRGGGVFAVCIQQLHINRIAWPERVGHIATDRAFGVCLNAAKLGQMQHRR